MNGSTGGILAAVRAVSKPGEKLIMARNSHKSVYNAAELCDAALFLIDNPNARAKTLLKAA